MENEEAVADELVVDDERLEEDTIVTIGEDPIDEEEAEAAKAPDWVRELRKSHKELTKKNRELQEQIAAKDKLNNPPPELGAKPTLEGCEYDEAKYDAALGGWYEKKREVDDRAKRIDAEKQTAEAAWQAKLAGYGSAKGDLKVKDFNDAEETVQNVMSVTQQGIIIQGAENPALVVYALGKNPKKAAELAAISDPVRYAFAIAKLEGQLKLTNRKAPPPEGTVKGTGSLSGATDGTLERLRDEAAKTGDYSKVMAYRNQKRKQTA